MCTVIVRKEIIMYAAEFYAVVKNGKIEVPVQYQNEFQSSVKVILLSSKQQKCIIADNKIKQAKGFGSLSHGAKPDLWEQEKGAWERAVIEKYGSN